MDCRGTCTGQNLNATAIAAANVIGNNLSAEEAAVLSAFFTVVGDALATIAATKAACKE